MLILTVQICQESTFYVVWASIWSYGAGSVVCATAAVVHPLPVGIIHPILCLIASLISSEIKRLKQIMD
jgi:hypothetical protein